MKKKEAEYPSQLKHENRKVLSDKRRAKQMRDRLMRAPKWEHAAIMEEYR